MLATALRAFWHDGRQVEPGDRLWLSPDEAAFLSARGDVRVGTVLMTREVVR